MDKPLNLNDIITPETVSFWPLAVGWWLVLLLSISAIIISIFLWQRHQKKWGYRRHSLKLLGNYIEQYKTKQHSADIIAKLVETIKRTSIAIYGNKSGASLTPQKFLLHLNFGVPQASFSQNTIDNIEEALYKNNNDFDIINFYQECCHWVKYHKETIQAEAISV